MAPTLSKACGGRPCGNRDRPSVGITEICRQAAKACPPPSHHTMSSSGAMQKRPGLHQPVDAWLDGVVSTKQGHCEIVLHKGANAKVLRPTTFEGHVPVVLVLTFHLGQKIKAVLAVGEKAVHAHRRKHPQPHPIHHGCRASNSFNTNAHLSACSSKIFPIGLPAPWPALVSTRKMTGRSPLCTA